MTGLPIRFVATFLLLLMSPTAAVSAADPSRYMDAELVAETLAPRPGSTILIGIRMIPRPGWHGYWSNPGDSGFVTRVEWSAPPGVTLGELLHPAPTLIHDGGISSFVHEGEHMLLAKMRLPARLAAGTAIPLAADLRYAACTATMCIPLRARLKLDLVVGNGNPGPAADMIARSARRLPREAAGGHYAIESGKTRLVLPGSIALDIGNARFFPDDNDVFRTISGQAKRIDGRTIIVGKSRQSPTGPFGGVVSDGRSAFRLTFTASPEEEPVTTPDPSAPEQAPAMGTTPTQPVPSPTGGETSQTDAAPQSRDRAGFTLLGGLAGLAALAGLLLMRRR